MPEDEEPGFTQDEAKRLLEVIRTFRDDIADLYKVPKDDTALIVGGSLCLKLFLSVQGPRMPSRRRRTLKKMVDWLANPE